ncbi:MAG: CmcJ/NvfI family oxidoreductase [Polyangiaceae bacterium]
MNQPEILNHGPTSATERNGSTYVPPLQRTAGQAAPIAAHGGLSYMAFDNAGDAGTAKALEDALSEIASGAEQRVVDLIDSAGEGPIATRWGAGFRSYDACLAHIRATGMRAPPGGVALPLAYTIHDRPTYSVVPSNALWRDPARSEVATLLRRSEGEIGRANLYFPQILRDARRIDSYYPELSPESPECHGSPGCLARTPRVPLREFLRCGGSGARVLSGNREAAARVLPGATDALAYNHDVFDKDYAGDRSEDQDRKNPGVNVRYANLVHNDLNDNSGRVRCRELLTRNLRNFGRLQQYTEAEADRKMSRRFLSINLAKPMETVEQFPFVLCAWPSFADQPYITNYRIYDDRVGETTRFTYRADHEWYWFPQQTPTEVSMLKCYDSVTDGSVSRWSFHTACVDPTAPANARCRKNVVVRSFVFF